MNRDPYYDRPEVSNSDLTALKWKLEGNSGPSPEATERAFRIGSLTDALLTEPGRLNSYTLRLDGEDFPQEDYKLAKGMAQALRSQARKDPFLAHVLKSADTQVSMCRKSQQFDFAGMGFTLDTRCKWDWWLSADGFGGDLKTTAAATQEQFEKSIDLFDWDRSRAWYMDIAGSDRDFIYAVSKQNFRVFRKLIRRDDDTYAAGREKYQELAYRYWLLHPNDTNLKTD